MKYGYARVSTNGQSTALQFDRLRKEGCELIIEEKVSGRKLDDRPRLQALLRDVEPGDTIVCVKIDRLARSVRDVLNIAHELRERRASLHVLEPAITLDGGPIGNLVLTIFAMVGELELTIMKERQLAGIKRAVAAGKWRGRARSNGRLAIPALLGAGLSPQDIVLETGCSRATVYREMAELLNGGGGGGGH